MSEHDRNHSNVPQPQGVQPPASESPRDADEPDPSVEAPQNVLITEGYDPPKR